MNVLFYELLIAHAGQFRMRLDVLVCNGCRLLHDITEVSCHCQDAFALADRTLDEQDFTSH